MIFDSHSQSLKDWQGRNNIFDFWIFSTGRYTRTNNLAKHETGNEPWKWKHIYFLLYSMHFSPPNFHFRHWRRQQNHAAGGFHHPGYILRSYWWGFSGFVSQSAVWPGSSQGKLAEWLTTEKPNIVLLHIGTNDVSVGNEGWDEVEDVLVVIDDYEATSGKSVWVI